MVYLSQKCYYGIRAVLDLAGRRRDVPISATEIAAAQGIPAKFLAIILAQLKQAGFVRSVRGMQGGYRLARAPAEITVHEVIAAMDGAAESHLCLRGRPADHCRERGTCALAALWRQASDAATAVFADVTFAELLEREQAAAAALESNYCI